jgi:hypothetical protein
MNTLINSGLYAFVIITAPTFGIVVGGNVADYYVNY